jgi:hypothetical protein
MYKYTPKKSVVKDILKIRRQYTPKRYEYINSILSEHGAKCDYTHNEILSDIHYLNFCLYSIRQLNVIYVAGYPFPVSIFDESVI